MQSRRFVLVGTRVVRPDVVALLETAQASGLDVRVAAQRPADRPSGWAPAGVVLDWHRVVDTRSGPGLGGLVTAWVNRAVRGAAASLAEQLVADPWLSAQVAGDQDRGAIAGGSTTAVVEGSTPTAGGEPEVVLVALDDTAAQALARWRTEAAPPSSDGRPWPVLTWDKGAEALAEEIAARWAQHGRPRGFPTPVPAALDRPLGARHTLTVVPAPEGGTRLGLREALQRSRTVVTAVDTGVVARPHLAADVLVLDGLGPAVLALPERDPSTTRVVRLHRVTDRRSPWRHLLDADHVDQVVPADPVDALATRDDSPVPSATLPPTTQSPTTQPLTDRVLAAALDDDTVALMTATAEQGDEAALALAARLLEEVAQPSTALLRELAFVTRVTGAVTLEAQVLERALAPPTSGGETHASAHPHEVPSSAPPQEATSASALPDARAVFLRRTLDRLRDRMLETEPGWLPPLGPAPVDDPVPGRVLHVLKTTLSQRQAGYSVRGHQSLRALVAAGADVVAVAAPQHVGTEQAGTDHSDLQHVGTHHASPQHAGTRPGPTSAEVSETVLDGVRYLVPPPVDGEGTAYLTAQAQALLEVVRRERPALVHVHSGGRGYDLGVVGAAVARAAGLPWVYEVRGLFESLWTRQRQRAERGETFERRMAKEAELLRAADAGITLAETMRADLVSRGVDPDHVRIVPNAVDPEALAPLPRDDALAQRWGLAGAFTFGYVTNLDHDREQVGDLVRAAVHLRNEGLPVRALIVGDGTRRDEIVGMVERLQAQDCVVLAGRVPHPEVAATYSLFDVLVVPRSDERAARLVTPLKPYEAMAMGLPVVVSRQPALLEIIGDGERGWSYPAGDAAALAALLRRLASDPAERTAVAARAREWVLAERTWAGNAHRYADLYEQVLGRSPRHLGVSRAVEEPGTRDVTG